MEPLSASKPLAAHNRPLVNDYAFQYRATDSPVHRMGAGWKLLLGTALCAAAIGANNPWLLAALLIVNAGYYFLARLSVAELLRDLWFFLVQMAVVIVLYMLRYGVPEGIWPGVRTSLRILLFFLPGIILLRTTRISQMMYSMRKILPYRLAFLVFTSLRFIPFFAREVREIAMAQRLRGARLAPRELLRPRNWPDLLNCLLLPLIIRALKTADEAALSAEARAFGAHPKRTYWNSGNSPAAFTGVGANTMNIEEKP
jgi:energy-coupling factor transporter transmembrane protein EcfT